jgi:prepilin-type processing-associated H-X9-DG protein
VGKIVRAEFFRPQEASLVVQRTGVTLTNEFMKPNQKTKGFTLIDLMITIAILIVLGLMLLPARTGNKPKATRITCTNNLKQVGLAFRVWAGEHQDKLPTQISVTNGGAMEAVLAGDVAAVFQVMSNELNTPKILFCPTDKKRIQAVTFDRAVPGKRNRDNISFLGNTNLTYFVGLDANDTSPSMFLSGDDNFLVGGNQAGFGGSPPPSGILSLTTNTPIAWNDTRHERQGNIGLADGSVQGFSSTALRVALANTGVDINRLAMP